MALLRQCLQELRTKNHDDDAPAGWRVPARPEQRRRGVECSQPWPSDKVGGTPAAAAHRLPTA